MGGNGENLWAGYGNAFSGAAAVKSWYDELTKPGYDFSKPGFSHGTGHFTQVVWKSTTRLVCAVHVCNPLRTKSGIPMGRNPGNFFVCEYSPPGNYQAAASSLPMFCSRVRCCGGRAKTKCWIRLLHTAC